MGRDHDPERERAIEAKKAAQKRAEAAKEPEWQDWGKDQRADGKPAKDIGREPGGGGFFVPPRWLGRFRRRR